MYSLSLKSDFLNQEHFIQIPYNISTYKDGSIFTLLNFHHEINGLDSELEVQQKELIEQCYLDFVTNYKD